MYIWKTSLWGCYKNCQKCNEPCCNGFVAGVSQAKWDPKVVPGRDGSARAQGWEATGPRTWLHGADLWLSCWSHSLGLVRVLEPRVGLLLCVWNNCNKNYFLNSVLTYSQTNSAETIVPCAPGEIALFGQQYFVKFFNNDFYNHYTYLD